MKKLNIVESMRVTGGIYVGGYSLVEYRIFKFDETSLSDKCKNKFTSYGLGDSFLTPLDADSYNQIILNDCTLDDLISIMNSRKNVNLS